MKETIKKMGKSIVTCFLMILSFVIAGASKVSAAGSYNRDAACNYGHEYYDECDELCSGFVSLCVNAGGLDVFSRSCTELRRQLLASDTGIEYDLALQSDMSIKMSDYPDKLEAGDVVFFYCPGCTDGKPYIHAVLCAGMDSEGYMRAYSTNNRNSGQYKYRYGSKCYACGTKISKAVVYHFDDVNSPMGHLDEIYGGAGSVMVRGWALDEDDVNKALEIHVYVGGPAGSGASCYVVPKADKLRKDVEDVYPGSGIYHGFQDTIIVNETGKKDVYVYAINIEGGDNVLIGQGTVDIKPGFKIDFAVDNVEMKIGDTMGVGIKFKGDGIYTLRYVLENNSCCKAKWTNSVNYTTGDTTINIIGAKEGNSSVTIQLLDRNYEVLYEKAFKVTVSGGNKSFTTSCDTLELEVGKTGDVDLWWSGYSDLAIIRVEYKTADGNAKYISASYKDLTNSGVTFEITGKSIGTDVMVVSFLDKERNVLATKELTLIVK